MPVRQDGTQDHGERYVDRGAVAPVHGARALHRAREDVDPRGGAVDAIRSLVDEEVSARESQMRSQGVHQLGAAEGRNCAPVVTADPSRWVNTPSEGRLARVQTMDAAGTRSKCALSVRMLEAFVGGGSTKCVKGCWPGRVNWCGEEVRTPLGRVGKPRRASWSRCTT
jgi:hypothetical protein